jgi:hypothetical protein
VQAINIRAKPGIGQFAFEEQIFVLGAYPGGLHEVGTAEAVYARNGMILALWMGVSLTISRG